MALIDTFVLRIKRGEGPFFAGLRRFILGVQSSNLPQPAVTKPLFRAIYYCQACVFDVLNGAVTFFIREPLFRARCEEVGKRLRLSKLPEVYGHTRIYLGDDVTFTGKLGIASGRFVDEPRLVIQNRAAVGHGSFISVNKEVIIEEDVIIANGCMIFDSDGHPRQADLRAANAPLQDRDIQPIRICRSAWIGRGSQIMKGVTVGAGAIVSAGSVVIADVPPYSLVMGNPAEVILRGVGKPSRKASKGTDDGRADQMNRASVAPQE